MPLGSAPANRLPKARKSLRRRWATFCEGADEVQGTEPKKPDVVAAASAVAKHAIIVATAAKPTFCVSCSIRFLRSTLLPFLLLGSLIKTKYVVGKGVP